MENWISWQTELTSLLNNNQYLKSFGLTATYCSEEVIGSTKKDFIRIKHGELSLNIDSDSYRNYYKTIAVPIYAWESSLKDAAQKCIVYIKKWTKARGIDNGD